MRTFFSKTLSKTERFLSLSRTWLSKTIHTGFEPGLSVRLSRGVKIATAKGGMIKLGDGTDVLRFAYLIAKSGKLHIGKEGFVGQGSIISAMESVSIGDNVLIAEHVTIRDQDHDYSGPLPTCKNGFVTAPIKIGDNVWIGAKATITKGVTIGNNVVIGANSVVTRDIPENVVAVGIPARVISKRGDRE